MFGLNASLQKNIVTDGHKDTRNGELASAGMRPYNRVTWSFLKGLI